MTAKVECAVVCHKMRSIVIDSSEKACVNCIWYEPFFMNNRGNIRALLQTSGGRCMKHWKERKALDKPCRGFEREEPHDTR